MACTWRSVCPQTGFTSTITFSPGATFGDGLWTMTLGGSVYEYNYYSSSDPSAIGGCAELLFLRVSGSDGPTNINVYGTQTPKQAGKQPNCCNTVGLAAIANPGNTASNYTLVISDQTGGATCLTGDPRTGTSTGSPILAQWTIGNGDGIMGETCEAGSGFNLDDYGGCVYAYFPGHEEDITVTLVSQSAPTDDPYVLVYAISGLEAAVGGAAASATFTISVPNPQP